MSAKAKKASQPAGELGEGQIASRCLKLRAVIGFCCPPPPSPLLSVRECRRPTDRVDVPAPNSGVRAFRILNSPPPAQIRLTKSPTFVHAFVSGATKTLSVFSFTSGVYVYVRVHRRPDDYFLLRVQPAAARASIGSPSPSPRSYGDPSHQNWQPQNLENRFSRIGPRLGCLPPPLIQMSGCQNAKYSLAVGHGGSKKCYKIS